MLKDSQLLDDLARVAGSAAGSVLGIKRELETAISSKVEEVLSRLKLATREESDVLRDMVSAARLEQEALKARLEALEARVQELENR